MTRIVAPAVARRLAALPHDTKAEILGVAGAGKSTAARILSEDPGFEMAAFIHARRPSHLLQIARGIPRLLPVLVPGIIHRPRISWRELKLLVYVGRWHLFLRPKMPRPGTVLLFDQGPLYALVRLKAEGNPFTTGRAFERWREEMLERWASELSIVIWLDAPDAVLWSRINGRDQGHGRKGEEEEAGYRFIDRYRRCFEDVLERIQQLGGTDVLRLDTSKAPAEQIAETIVRRRLMDRSSADLPVPMPGSGHEGDRDGR